LKASEDLMQKEIRGLKEKALKQASVNRNLFQKLQKSKPKNLDEVVHQLHDEVFESVDCLTCANCCKTTSPIFYMQDILRVSKSLKLKPSKFIDSYLHVDEDGDYVLNTAPCPFLNADNTCFVYESRPTACREYPHTNRKRFYQVLDLTLKNVAICPAVSRIVENLHKVLR